MLTSLIAGALLIAPMVSAQPAGSSPGAATDLTERRLSFRGLADSVAPEAAAEVAAIASEFLCGPIGSDGISEAARIAATEIANATALAITTATAFIAINDPRFRSRTPAQIEAEAIESAIIDTAANVDVCGVCPVAPVLWGRSYGEILVYVNSMSESLLDVDDSGASSPGPEDRAATFRDEFISASTPATANALIVLRGAIYEGCSPTILADISSGLNGVECTVRASGEAIAVSFRTTTFAARAAKAIAAKPCGIEVETNVEVAVSQVAEALAIAIAGVEANCFIAGDSYACFLADAEITATANATAFAFAAAYAEETETCGAEVCTLSVESLAEVVQTVLVRATSALYLRQCSGPNTLFDISDFQATLAEVILAPLVEIIDQIQVVSGKCSVTVPVFAIPGAEHPIPTCAEECAPNMTACLLASFDAPRACCSPDYICVRRDETFSQCRYMGLPGTFRPWDGREEVCIPRD